MTWTSPDPWACYCGATGLGGRPGHERHVDDHPAPKPEPVSAGTRVLGPVVPDGVDSRDVRAWAKANGWPQLGQRGRIPQDAIDAYMAGWGQTPQPDPRPRLNVEDIDELRSHGLTTEAIAQRLGVTRSAIEKAESRRRQP